MPELLAYTGSSGEKLAAHVFHPTGPTDHRTTVLQLHGGAWRSGGPGDLSPRSAALAARGFTAVAIEYSTVGRRPWPAALDDIGAAVGWATARARDWGVEPDRLALQGFSAGGHLALMYAAMPPMGAPRPKAVMACYPPSSLRPDVRTYRVADLRADVDLDELIQASTDGLPAWLLLGDLDTPAIAEASSPLGAVHAALPPVALVHGDADRLVNVRDSVDLWHALHRAGVTAELHIHAGQVHEFDAAQPYLDLVQDQAALFFERYVVGAAALDARQLKDNPLAGAQGLGRSDHQLTTKG